MKKQKYFEKKQLESTKQNKKIWKALGIEKVVANYGFAAVKMALNKWVNYQRENAKLLREKQSLEEKLAEIKGKL